MMTAVGIVLIWHGVHSKENQRCIVPLLPSSPKCTNAILIGGWAGLVAGKRLTNTHPRFLLLGRVAVTLREPLAII